MPRTISFRDHGKKCASANGKMDAKVNVVQNSYLGHSISSDAFYKFTLHLKFQTQGIYDYMNDDSRHVGSMRKITSGFFSSISSGIFNYLFIRVLHPVRGAHIPRTSRWDISYFSLFFIRSARFRTSAWRRSEEHDEWDIYFRTTIYNCFCDL